MAFKNLLLIELELGNIKMLFYADIVNNVTFHMEHPVARYNANFHTFIDPPGPCQMEGHYFHKCCPYSACPSNNQNQPIHNGHCMQWQCFKMTYYMQNSSNFNNSSYFYDESYVM